MKRCTHWQIAVVYTEYTDALRAVLLYGTNARQTYSEASEILSWIFSGTSFRNNSSVGRDDRSVRWFLIIHSGLFGFTFSHFVFFFFLSPTSDPAAFTPRVRYAWWSVKAVFNPGSSTENRSLVLLVWGQTMRSLQLVTLLPVSSCAMNETDSAFVGLPVTRERHVSRPVITIPAPKMSLRSVPTMKSMIVWKCPQEFRVRVCARVLFC